MAFPSMDDNQTASELRSAIEEAQALAREQIAAAWQLQVDRVREQLEAGWRIISTGSLRSDSRMSNRVSKRASLALWTRAFDVAGVR